MNKNASFIITLFICSKFDFLQFTSHSISFHTHIPNSNKYITILTSYTLRFKKKIFFSYPKDFVFKPGLYDTHMLKL